MERPIQQTHAMPEQPPRLREQLNKPERPDQYSGFIVLRLAGHSTGGDTDDLMAVAKKQKLPGLMTVLNEYDLNTTRRVVRSQKTKQILELERRATQTHLPPLHSLSAYWRIDIREKPERTEEILKRLNGLYEIEYAYRELAVTDPLVNAADDTYASDQDYLDAAPTGVDARWAWNQPDSEGAGVGIMDLEQGWFPSHEDLVAKTPTLIYGDNRDGVGTYKGNHGTAVLGEMIAEDNALGVVGISPGVSSVRMVSHYDAGTNTALHVADAIVAAIPNLTPGDVLLLEVQRSYRPSEIDDADFDAIRLASALGIVVIEAAGNGGEDLDAYTSAGGDQILNRLSADFRESGAIMVGASESALPHDRWLYSNFGTRIDCYGWGQNVVTCGYGDLDNGGGDDNRTYTDTFQGTSSASPMIVGCAAILQGKYEASTGTRLSPGQMRALLSDPATGTPQGAGRAGDIGVMPNLREIIQNTLDLTPDIYLRDNLGDSGVIPSTGSISASPDIIVRPAMEADPTAAFGQGSGTEYSNTLGYEAEAGQDNFIYVRCKNRGSSDATGMNCTLYWSEVATLVTPDLWHLIGTTTPTDCPQGDTLVVCDALTWAKAQIPATGHYCFVGVLDHPQDEAPPIPASPISWDDFRGFIRNNNNVTWRNFNVVDNIPDPAGDPASLPFLVTGAPDRARVFDLEIIQRLPRGADVWMEMPLNLAHKLTGRLWKMEVDRKRQTARLRLPSQPVLDLYRIKLPISARFKCRFLVKGAKGMEKGGHSIAIRQLYDCEEVGRVTWQFHVRRKEEQCQKARRKS